MLAARLLKERGELRPEPIAQLLLISGHIRELVPDRRHKSELRALVGGRHAALSLALLRRLTMVVGGVSSGLGCIREMSPFRKTRPIPREAKKIASARDWGKSMKGYSP